MSIFNIQPQIVTCFVNTEKMASVHVMATALSYGVGIETRYRIFVQNNWYN